MVVVGLLAVLSAGALIATSKVLQRTTSEVSAAVESVRLVEEAEISLLLHGRARDPVLRHDIESDLNAALAGAQQFVTSASERSVMLHASARVAQYLAVAGGDAVQAANAEAAAYAALEQLVAINIEHTRAAHAEANAWQRISNVMGIVLGLAIVGITIALLLWLRRRVIRPLLSLADTVRRFGAGQRTARAVESGPLEIQEMSRRFNEMAESIATQRQANVAFLGGVAHDLRTPLSALGLAVDLLDPNEPLPAEPQLRRTIEVIARQIHHLERMVGDFVDMSTIEQGELELHVGERDVRDIVRDVVGLFSENESMRGRLQVSVPHEPCLVVCDEVRIGQAITNLLSNAIKYSPSDTPIAVGVRATAGDVIIEVADHGAGIAREDHERIFEPFRRVGARDLAKGAGLGLFNVKRIVEAHDGRIEVESVPRLGSTFRIHLPARALR